MREIEELGSGIEKLKKSYGNQKHMIEQLEKDRAFLIERTRFLGQKLNEAYMIYEEAGKRILDFVDKEVEPIKNQISEIKAEARRISLLEHELKSQSSLITKMRSSEDEARKHIAESEKSLRMLNGSLSVLREHVDKFRESESRDETVLDSKISEVKNHFESRLKTTEGRIGLKITEASEEVLQDAMDSVNNLAASYEESKKRLADIGLFVKQLRVNTASLKKQMQNAGLNRAELEKKVSDQNVSIKGLESSLGKLSKRLESIGLEDEALEKRLSQIRKDFEERVASKAGQLKFHIDSKSKRQAELLGSEIKSISADFQGRILGLSKRLDGIKLEKRLLDVRKAAEAVIGSKTDHLKSHIDSVHKRQQELLESRIVSLSKSFEADITKLDEKLAYQKKQIDDAVSYIDGKIRESREGLSARESVIEREIAKLGRISNLRDGELSQKIEKQSARLETLISEQRTQSELQRHAIEKRLLGHTGSINGIESTIANLSKRLDGIKLEDDKLEKRLFDARKAAEAVIGSKTDHLKSHIDSVHKRQQELLDSRVKSLSVDFDSKVSRMNEKILAENERANRDMEALATRLSKRLDGMNLDDKKFEKKLAETFSGFEGSIDSKLRQFRLQTEADRKNFEEGAESKAGQLKSHIAENQKKNLEMLESRIGVFGGRFESKLEASIARLSKRLDGISLEDEALEKKLSEIRKHSEQMIESKVSRLKTETDAIQKSQSELLESAVGSLSEKIDGRIAKINEKLLAEKSRADKELEASILRLSKRLDGIKLEDDKLEKRLFDARKAAEAVIGSKTDHLKSHIDSVHKRQQELLDSRVKSLSVDFDSKVSRMNEKILAENERANRDMEALATRLSKRLDGMNLDDKKFEKKLAETFSGFEGSIDSKLRQFRLQTEADRKNFEEGAESKAGQLKSHIAENQKKNLEMLESRIGVFGGRFEKRLGDNISALSKRLDGIKLEDDKLEKRLSDIRKEQSELLSSRLNSLSEDIDNKIAGTNEKILAEKTRANKEIETSIFVLSKRLDSIGLEDEALEKRLSTLKKHSEEMVRASEKKQSELFASRVRAIADDLVSRISDVNEKTSEEKAKIKEFESNIDKKLAESQKLLASKISGFDDGVDKKLSQVYSHVASEKKALAETRALLEREIKDEQRTLSSKINALSEKTEKLVSNLSEQISLEKKALSEERAKFSENIRTEGHAIAKVNEFSKSLDSRFKKSEDEISEKIKGVETALSKVLEKVQTTSEELTKIGLLPKNISARLGKVESQFSSEKRDSSQRINSLERESRNFSSAISSLSKKQDFDKNLGKTRELLVAEIGKKVSVQQEYIKKLESALGKIVNRLEGVNLEDSKLEKRLSDMGGNIEMLQKLIEESRPLQQKMDEISEVQDKTGKRMMSVEGALKEFLEKATDDKVKLAGEIQEIKGQLAEAGGLVKARQESAILEVSKMRSEISKLKKDITEWKGEQARLYELLKEED